MNRSLNCNKTRYAVEILIKAVVHYNYSDTHKVWHILSHLTAFDHMGQFNYEQSNSNGRLLLHKFKGILKQEVRHAGLATTSPNFSMKYRSYRQVSTSLI